MNTIFCNRCGQANLPNSINCMKCNNFLNQERKTINTNIKTKNDNTKLYWLIGGISAALFLGTFFISVVGAGSFLYIASNRKPVPPQPPVPPIPPKPNTDPVVKVPDTEKKDDILAKMTNENIKNYINDDLKRVGKYKLIKTETPTPFFINSKTEQSGVFYPDDSEKNVVIFIMATYLSVADSKDFIQKKTEAISQYGGKVTYSKSSLDGDTIVYETKDGIVRIINCNKGVCFNIQSNTSQDTSDFYKAYQAMPSK